MKNPIKSLVHSAGRWYLDKICRDEFEQQSFRRINERPSNSAFFSSASRKQCRGRCSNVGTGTTALPSLLRTCGCVVTAIDNVRDYWSNGMSNRHWHVIDDDITRPRLNSQYDMVSCISVLEHIVDHNAAMRSMFSLVAPGGFVLLTFPYNETRYVDNVYKLAGAGYGQDAPTSARSTPARRSIFGCARTTRKSSVKSIGRLFPGSCGRLANRFIPQRKLLPTRCIN